MVRKVAMAIRRPLPRNSPAEFGVKFGINVIGFGIEPKEKAELATIAEKGHGKL